jgi:hypothetical protein
MAVVLSLFFKEIMFKFDSDQYVVILLRAIFKDRSPATLGEAQRINKHDFKKILESYIARLM